jgi:hypothetical protein
MISRRSFLLSAAAAAGVAVAQPVLGTVAGRDPLTRKQRIDRALAGQDVDRPPFTHWHHFGPQTPEEHAKATLDYHWKYKTDIVKVMSDYPYPKPEGNWYELKVLDNPFPEQIRALELIRDGTDCTERRIFSKLLSIPGRSQSNFRRRRRSSASSRRARSDCSMPLRY